MVWLVAKVISIKWVLVIVGWLTIKPNWQKFGMSFRISQVKAEYPISIIVLCMQLTLFLLIFTDNRDSVIFDRAVSWIFRNSAAV